MRQDVHSVINRITKVTNTAICMVIRAVFNVKCRYTAETGGFLRQLSDERKVFSLERNEVDKAGSSLHNSCFDLHCHAGFCRGE